MSSVVAKSSSSSAGNGLVATSDISAGQHVLQIAPDVIAPAWPCSMTELDEEEKAVVQLESGAVPHLDHSIYQLVGATTGCVARFRLFGYLPFVAHYAHDSNVRC